MPFGFATSETRRLDDPAAAARELAAGLSAALGGPPTAAVLFVPFRGLAHRAFAAACAEALPGCAIAGATTYGAISNGRVLERSAVAAGFAGVPAGLGSASGLVRDSAGAGRAAVESALRALAGPARLLVLIHEPQMGDPAALVEGARAAAPGIPLIGGGSGTGFVMEQSPFSMQLAGGRALAGSVVALALGGDFALSLGFSVGAEPCSEVMTLTKARRNILLEFDGRPALDALEEALGAPFSQACVSFVNFGCQLVEPGETESIMYGLWGVSAAERALFCGTPIPEGKRFRFVRIAPETIVEQQRAAAERARKALGAKPLGALNFDCYGRKLALNARGLIEGELAALHEPLGGAPVAGMYSGSETAAVDWGRPGATSRYGHGCSSFALFGAPK